MSRLTITLDDALHQALQETATKQGRSMGKIIEEGLILRGIKPIQRTQETVPKSSAELLARARRHANLSQNEALEIAVQETRAERRA